MNDLSSRLTALKADRQRLTAEWQLILERCVDAGRDIDAGERERTGNLQRGIDKIDRDILEVEGAWRAELTEGMRSGTLTAVSGDGATAIESFNVNRGQDDPWTSRSESFGSDPATAIRNRAEAAVSRVRFSDVVDVDATRERATTLIERSHEEGDSVLSEWVVATSAPAYARAMTTILNNPIAWPALLEEDERQAVKATQTPAMRSLTASTDVERAAMSLTGGNGGYLMPFSLDPSVIITNNGVMNPMREISSIKTVTTNVWHGVASAGVLAEWLAEAAEVADDSPTFTQPTIPVFKGAAWLQASFELNMDTDVSSEVMGLITDAKDRLESNAFSTGTGSGEPKGIITALQAVTASRVAGSSGAAGAADFVLGDVYALDNALYYRYRKDPKWLAHISIYNKIRRFAEGTTGNNASFWTELGGGRPPSLLGHSAYEASALDSTIVSGSNDDVLVLGDFKQYYIVDRVGTTMIYNPLVLGSNRRPTGEVGWFAFFRTGADTVNADAFRYLRL